KDFLDQNFGDKYILMITADHGCAPLPEISGGQRLTVNKVFSALNSLLPPEEKESLAAFMTVGQISLNRELVKKYGITESQIRKKILGIKGSKGTGFFEDVVFRSEIPVQ
ncbi:MAG TPA: type I phosphodiesterase/nucleotide pyrophosphatase, partial [Leptospiraceae bacterium]|nr:type I phosphodiesterase/nucleotide pyrophosphatase [Leptospiraceae bacterium]